MPSQQIISEDGHATKLMCSCPLGTTHHKSGATQRFLTSCIMLCVVLFSVQSTTTAEERPLLKVGVLLSLSGGLEQWCSYIRQGVELAVDEYKTSNVKIIIEDDRSVDKNSASSAAHKLIDRDGVDALYTWTLSNAPVLTPTTKRARIPLVIGAYDDRILRAGDYLFGSVVNYQLISRDIARFFKARGAHRVALVLAIDDWSASFEAPFRAEAAKLGLDVVYSESISATETETRSIVTNLKQRQVDGVLAPLYGNALLSFIRRHREMKAQSLINVGDGMFESDIKALGEAAEGVTATQIWLESRELKERVQVKFGITLDPLQLGLVASGYDVMVHIIKAASDLRNRGLDVTGETLNEALKSFKSVGYLGEYMLGAPPVTAGARITVIERGRYQLAERK